MKNQIFALVFIAFIVRSGHAQKKDSCYAGVYLNFADFIKNRVVQKINTDREGYDIKIKMNDAVKITTPDTLIQYKGGSIFGYYVCGNRYRYSPGNELNAPEDFYKIEDTTGLILYSSVFFGGAEFFYSLNFSSPIHRLSKIHLRKDFSHSPEFISEIKKVKSLYGLSVKDDKGTFILNTIYNRTVKKK
jgi:hypothetical protein